MSRITCVKRVFFLFTFLGLMVIVLPVRAATSELSCQKAIADQFDAFMVLVNEIEAKCIKQNKALAQSGIPDCKTLCTEKILRILDHGDFSLEISISSGGSSYSSSFSGMEMMGGMSLSGMRGMGERHTRVDIAMDKKDSFQNHIAHTANPDSASSDHSRLFKSIEKAFRELYQRAVERSYHDMSSFNKYRSSDGEKIKFSITLKLNIPLGPTEQVTCVNPLFSPIVTNFSSVILTSPWVVEKYKLACSGK